MHRRFGIAALFFTLTSAAAFAAAVGGCSYSSSPDVSTSDNNDAGDNGSDEASTIDADNGAPSTVYPAPHPAIAQVQSFGGPVITSPHVVPVFFPGDAYQAQLETYLLELAANDAWSTAVKEYGVTNPLTVGASIVLADSPPANISSDDVDTMVKSVASGQAVLQAGSVAATPDENTIYALFYPTTTIISEAAGYDSCQAFGGYHGDDTVTLGDGGSVRVTYALVPRCPTFYAGEGLTGIDEVTAGLTHEVAEAVTDPFSETQAAYLAADYDHKIYGVVLAASEIGDMCSWEERSTSKPAGLDFQTSRVWSNAAAAAGHDPCVPAPSDPYFATVPDLQDDVPIPEYAAYGANGKPVIGGTTKGVRIAVGETKTVDLVLYSDGPTSGPWTVGPEELVAAGVEPSLTLSLDRNSGVNGERLHLSITRVKAIQPGHGNHIRLWSSIGPATATGRMSLGFIYVTQ